MKSLLSILVFCLSLSAFAQPSELMQKIFADRQVINDAEIRGLYTEIFNAPTPMSTMDRARTLGLIVLESAKPDTTQIAFELASELLSLSMGVIPQNSPGKSLWDLVAGKDLESDQGLNASHRTQAFMELSIWVSPKSYSSMVKLIQALPELAERHLGRTKTRMIGQIVSDANALVLDRISRAESAAAAAETLSP